MDANSPEWHRSTFVDWIDPGHRLGLLDAVDIEIDHHRFVIAAHQHAFEWFVRAGVDLLVRHERRHEDEIARTGLGGEFEPFAPAHAGTAAHHIDHAFELAVVMRAGLGIGMDRDRAGPEFLRAGAREVDRRLAVHARRLRGVGVERVAGDDADAVMLPFRFAHGGLNYLTSTSSIASRLGPSIMAARVSPSV